ncbi:uncharacterized protein ACRADG_002351 [Cochliomyia hominivorax]
MLRIKVKILLAIICFGVHRANSELINHPVATIANGSVNEPVILSLQDDNNALTPTEIEQHCQGLEYQFKGHPTDRHKYLLCLPNGSREMSCDAKCFDERNPPCSDCPATSGVPDHVKKYCKEEPNTLLHRVANEQDCQSYFLCLGETDDPLHLDCPENQHFSKKHKKCMNYYEADCLATTKWCKNRKDGTRFPNEKCYGYYECRKEETVRKACKYGEHFNADLGKCVKGICHDDKREPNCKKVKDGVRLAHPKCHKYYVCLNQSPFEVQCTTGYYFDVNNDRCERDVNNVCNDV